MKPRVYLETSVISYWTAPPSRDTRDMRHIANEDIRQRLRNALEKRNIVCPKLATPLEFLGD